MIDILVPDEEEGTKAVVRNWLKSIGDRVEADEPLVEIETDKVTMEVASPGDGILAEILLKTDDDAPSGALLGRLSTEAGSTAAMPEAEKAPAAKEALSEKAPGAAPAVQAPVPSRPAGCHGIQYRPGCHSRNRARRSDHARRCREGRRCGCSPGSGPQQLRM